MSCSGSHLVLLFRDPLGFCNALGGFDVLLWQILDSFPMPNCSKISIFCGELRPARHSHSITSSIAGSVTQSCSGRYLTLLCHFLLPRRIQPVPSRSSGELRPAIKSAVHILQCILFSFPMSCESVFDFVVADE